MSLVKRLLEADQILTPAQWERVQIKRLLGYLEVGINEELNKRYGHKFSNDFRFHQKVAKVRQDPVGMLFFVASREFLGTPFEVRIVLTYGEASFGAADIGGIPSQIVPVIFENLPVLVDEATKIAPATAEFEPFPFLVQRWEPMIQAASTRPAL